MPKHSEHGEVQSEHNLLAALVLSAKVPTGHSVLLTHL